MSHPNIVPFLGAHMEQFGLWMVSEWMSQGTITKYSANNPDANVLQLVSTLILSANASKYQSTEPAF
jgi:serine/threonine protein kinase